MATYQIKSIVLSDGTELDASALAYISVSSKGNLQIASPDSKNLNIESNKNVKVKPGDGGQVELLPDNTGDLEEVLVKVHTSIDSEGAELDTELPVRLKINSTELELNTKDAADVNPYDIKFKTGLKSSKSGEHYCQAKLKARSFDLRCYEHGGIALQPCGTDSDSHENKIKFETSRQSDVDDTNPTFSEEGGQGIEIGTINSQFTSLYTKTYRFKADAPIYAVTRGALVTEESGKVDYPTQSDDSKDILPSDSCTWAQIVAAVKYMKTQGWIS